MYDKIRNKMIYNRTKNGQQIVRDVSPWCSYLVMFIYFIATPLSRAKHGTGPEREREREREREERERERGRERRERKRERERERDRREREGERRERRESKGSCLRS